MSLFCDEGLKVSGHFIPNAVNIRHEIVLFIDKNLKSEDEVKAEINGNL